MKMTKTVFIAGIVSFCYGKILPDIIRVPEDLSTIQSAILVAFAGDTVLVSPGVYHENVSFEGKDIILGSLFLTSGNKEYVSATVIDPDTGSVVTFAKGETQNAILCGFTITGGTGTNIDSTNKDLVFGAGIFIRSASPVIRKNLITCNATWPACFGRGGGIAIMDSANPLIVGNTITENSVLGPCTHTDYPGGGIWVDATSNPMIGGSLDGANNIYSNHSEFGLQLYRAGLGSVINAQFNYLGRCPPTRDDVDPQSQFDTSNCLDMPVKVEVIEERYSPTDFQLLQNYPNPFNASTMIEFLLPYPSHVSLEFFNLHGKKVATLVNRKLMAGRYEIHWEARDLASGVYLYRLRTDGFVETRKLIVLK